MRGGIVLAGGRSQRMGMAKAELPFGAESMLARVVRTLGETCATIVVVAADGQALPELPGQVVATRDRWPDRGPLEGIAAGLAALPDDVDAAFVAAVDMPLVSRPVVERMYELLGNCRLAMPVVAGIEHPLTAVYHRDTRREIEILLAGGRFAPRLLARLVPTRRVSDAELRAVDPGLHALANVNTVDDYRRALAQAGLRANQSVLAALDPPTSA